MYNSLSDWDYPPASTIFAGFRVPSLAVQGCGRSVQRSDRYRFWRDRCVERVPTVARACMYAC